MYIPLAVHKNELVEINSMDTFSHYFCLAKKQKMTPLAAHVGLAPQDEDSDEEKNFYEDGAIEIVDEDDEL